MTDTQKTNELSTKDRLSKLEAQRQQVYRTILKEAIANDPAFEKMREAIRNAKRYQNQVDSLLTDEGFTKAKERAEAKVKEAQAELTALTNKREIATKAKSTLDSVVAEHDRVQAKLGEELSKVLASKDVDYADEGKVSKLIADVLQSANVSAIPVAVDPFA